MELRVTQETQKPTSLLKVLAELILLGVLGHLGTHGDVSEVIWNDQICLCVKIQCITIGVYHSSMDHNS